MSLVTKKGIEGSNCFYIYSFMHLCMDSTNTIECLPYVKHCSRNYDYSGMRVSPRSSFFAFYPQNLRIKYSWSQALLKLKCSGSCLRLAKKGMGILLLFSAQTVLLFFPGWLLWLRTQFPTSIWNNAHGGSLVGKKKSPTLNYNTICLPWNRIDCSFFLFLKLF